jgi:hypothetical protein
MPGVTNVVADALSRRDSEAGAELSALSAPSFHIFDTLRQEIEHELDLRRLREEVLASSRGVKWKMVDGGLITVASRVYVPATSPVHFEALANAHGEGHEGVNARSIDCEQASTYSGHARRCRTTFEHVQHARGTKVNIFTRSACSNPWTFHRWCGWTSRWTSSRASHASMGSL